MHDYCIMDPVVGLGQLQDMESEMRGPNSGPQMPESNLNASQNLEREDLRSQNHSRLGPYRNYEAPLFTIYVNMPGMVT